MIKKFPSVWGKNVRKPQGGFFLTHTVCPRDGLMPYNSKAAFKNVDKQHMLYCNTSHHL